MNSNAKNMSNRVKAIAVAALMCLSATAMTVPSAVKTDSMMSISASAASQSLAVGDTYKGNTADIAASGLKTVTVNVTADFTGNLSYGFGISTDATPYWFEYDGKSWVDTKGGTVEVPGIEVPVTAGQETAITIDVSSLSLKYKDEYNSEYDGTFEFRNYYGGKVTVNSITANGASTPTTPGTPSNPSNPSNPSTPTSGSTLTDEKGANTYRAKTADLAASGIKNITIVLDTGDYSGNFSYGFGISIADSPYWMEYDGKSWVDTKDGTVEVPGTDVAVNGGEVTIVIDTSKLALKYKDENNSEWDGEFEFRNYYSGGNTVTIKSITANGTATPTPPTPNPPDKPTDDHPNAIKDGNTKNPTSGSYTFKDNGNGTGTMTATQARQLEFETPFVLTKGYDEETYAAEGKNFVEGVDPINSHKFAYSDFGISNIGSSVTIESLMATIQSEADVKTFMYGGGMNVENGSPADTESAKLKAGVAKDENAGYWYNDMGEEIVEECKAAGVEFGITPGNGYFLSSEDNQLGSYFNVFWDVPEEVKPYETSGEISFQYWYGVENAEEYTEVEKVDLLSGVLTYTENATFDFAGKKKTDVNKEIAAGDMSGELSFADLGIKANQDVQAVVFTVSAGSDLDKLVYGIGASVGEDWKQWSPEDAAWDYVVLNSKSGDVEIAWIVPSGMDINEEYGNLQFGYWYGGKGGEELKSVTLKSVEVYYSESPEESTTEPATDPTTEPATDPATDGNDMSNLPEANLWGDADCSGEVDIIDVVIMNRAFVGIETITPQGRANADVDKDLKISLSDSMNVLRLLVDLLSQADFPIKD
ncbi:MAG: DUF5620 domain-containing protein [Oscillospiraceae bacterium]|nr:DUF5620 domain-containing protein [Oscillospiraceae bacterium]